MNNDGLLNIVEMAFRAYDPCFGCATSFAVGQVLLEIAIYDKNKNLLRHIVVSGEKGKVNKAVEMFYQLQMFIRFQSQPKKKPRKR